MGVREHTLPSSEQPKRSIRIKSASSTKWHNLPLLKMGTTLFLWCDNDNNDGSSATDGGVDTTGSVGTTSPSS